MPSIPSSHVLLMKQIVAACKAAGVSVGFVKDSTQIVVKCETCGSWFLPSFKKSRHSLLIRSSPLCGPCHIERRKMPKPRPSIHSIPIEVRNAYGKLRVGYRHAEFRADARENKQARRQDSKDAENAKWDEYQKALKLGDYADNRPEQGYRQRAIASGERIDRREIFRRDANICGICGLPVDRSLTHPAPLAPTLDHIEPLRHGGEHATDNVQTAHSYCNTAKNARTLTDSEVDAIRHHIESLLSLRVSACESAA